MDDNGTDVWMTPEEAARYLKLSVQTLANKRCNGTGPAYSATCGVRYRRSALDAWMMGDGLSHTPSQARATKAMNEDGAKVIQFQRRIEAAAAGQKLITEAPFAAIDDYLDRMRPIDSLRVEMKLQRMLGKVRKVIDEHGVGQRKAG